MPPPRKSAAVQSAKLTLELLPLYSNAIPERSRKRLAKNPPDGPLLLEGVNRHIATLSAAANADPLVFIPQSKVVVILHSLQMRIPSRIQLPSAKFKSKRGSGKPLEVNGSRGIFEVSR